MKKAVLFKKDKKKGFVECTCCRHKCVISPNGSGICGVRQNLNGELYLRVYGKPVAVNVDPVEKKPLYHFLPGAKIFSFGTIGCNFRCKFCQNWDISQKIANVRKEHKNSKESEFIIDEMIAEECQELMPEEIVSYCRENKIPAIAYTYNEPTIFTEYAADTAKLAKKYGIKNVYVSNGYESEECLKYMKDWCDAINIDIKSFDEKFYNEVCGAKLSGVLETLKMAWKMGIWVECTTLIIPGVNDSKEELSEIAEFMASVSTDMPWHVTAFHPDYQMMDRSITPVSTLEMAWEIGKKAGLKYVYIGNIGENSKDNTLCSKCGELLVERVGMGCLKCVVKVEEKVGKCPKCNEKILGIWS